MACQSGKQRYATEAYARAQLVGAIMAANRGSKTRREIRVYHCPLCKGWHLTSKPERK